MSTSLLASRAMSGPRPALRLVCASWRQHFCSVPPPGWLTVLLKSHFPRSNRPTFSLGRPFNAITFGHVVVLATSQTELDRLRAHEQAHVRQYEKWAVFFFVAYPAASLWQLLRCRRPYIDTGSKCRRVKGDPMNHEKPNPSVERTKRKRDAYATLNSTRRWRSQSEFWYQRSSHCSS